MTARFVSFRSNCAADKLYHFSEDPDITYFEPRAVVRSRPRPAKWLNQPLVWAISEQYEFLYHFPRDCPRIVIWATDQTTPDDATRWLGEHPIVAYVQNDWIGRINTATVYRYHMPGAGFEMLDDVGMAVSRQPVIPEKKEALTDLPALLSAKRVCVRSMPSLGPIKRVWDSTLHASGIRLKNAA